MSMGYRRYVADEDANKVVLLNGRKAFAVKSFGGSNPDGSFNSDITFWYYGGHPVEPENVERLKVLLATKMIQECDGRELSIDEALELASRRRIGKPVEHEDCDARGTRFCQCSFCEALKVQMKINDLK